MKTLYLDCGMGAAGDMLTAALLELIPEQNQDLFLSEMNTLGIPGVKIINKPTTKCGICGTQVIVSVNGQDEGSGHGHNHNHDHDEHEHENDHDHKHGQVHSHQHNGMREIENIIKKLYLPAKVQADVLAVYSMIAEAESHVHGVPITDIHFHEVGTMDAIADITAVCLLMDKIDPDQVIVSPVHVGSGQVRCAHGILPVPAPATAYILRDVPIYGGSIRGELCTPTGAALLKHFASSYGDMPVIKTQAIGYGMGKKNFEAANCVRAILGETSNQTDSVYELRCNVDDMTAEEIAFAMERLYEAGALEVFTTPVGMKKSRPGVLITVLCQLKDRGKLLPIIFKYTTTIGVREEACIRYVLDRKIITMDTAYGAIRRKDSSGYGISRSKYEHEDLARIAQKKNISIAEVYKMLPENKN